MATFQLRNKILTFVVSTTAVAFLVGCPGGSSSGGGGGDPTAFSVAISGAPSLTKPGATLTLKADVKNSPGGTLTYVWAGSSVTGNGSRATVQVPEIGDACDDKLAVKVTAKDSSGKTAEFTREINISKTWCTYTLTNTPSLLSLNITDVEIGQKNKLWIGTKAGLNSFDGTKWESFVDVDGLANPEVTELLSVGADLYVASFSSAPPTSSVQKFSQGVWSAWKLSNDEVPNLRVDVLATRGNGLVYGVSAGAGRIDNLMVSDSNLVTDVGVNAILNPTGAGNVPWYGTSAGIYLDKGDKDADGNPILTKTYSGSEWGGVYDSRFSTDNINVGALAQDNSGNIWLGLRTSPNGLGYTGAIGGLVKYDATTNAWTKPVLQLTLKDTDVRALAKDRDGDIWVATSLGLGKIPGGVTPVSLDAPIKANAVKGQGGFSVDDLQDLACDATTNTLWIATNGGGLTRLRVGLME